MFNIPNDVVKFFFCEINKKGKYTVKINENKAYIIARVEEQYYKPVIVIKDIEEFRVALYDYIDALTLFYSKTKNKKDYHDLSYFFNNLIFNMTYTDSEDFTKYIYKRIAFFENNEFSEYDEKTLICEYDNIKFFVKRIVEEPGLETPHILIFEMEYNNNIYPLPLIRYGIDSDNICHIFAIQFGRNREYDTSILEYKNIVNKVNTGMNKYRNVSPSFILSFTLFIKLLQEKNIKDIIVPGFLFARYRNYYKATTVKQSNLLLNRIINNFALLMERMEYEIDGFEITSFLEETESYTRIKLNNLESKNKLVRNIIKK